MEREVQTNQEWVRMQSDLEIKYDSDAASGTNVTEWTPVRYNIKCHEEVYKTLATQGDFPCRIYYREEELDPERTSGIRSIVVLTTEEFLDPVGDHENKEFTAWFSKPGTILVNAICRCPAEGQSITSTRDCRDCVKWLSAQDFLAQFNGNKDKIYVVDENNSVVLMNYDSLSASLSVNEPISFDIWDNKVPFPGNEDLLSPASSASSSELPADIIGDGSVSLVYNTLFSSGSISFSALKSNFGGGNSINTYYRGGNAVVNVSNNNNVPTGGTISFSQFRNSTNKVSGHCNGNFSHLQMRWEVYGDTLWQSKLNKTTRLSGHAGAINIDNPALRFNNSGQGTIELETAGSGFAMGEPGQPGGGGGGRGNDGGWAIHLASTVKISDSVWTGRVKGAGGGGGGGGNGGRGGGGGHSGVIKCTGWFCNGRARDCRRDGGNGGNGGNGGQGGWGRGYAWNGSAWIDTAVWQGGQGGNGGGGGNSRSGGNGGGGGSGGSGGGWGGRGAGGNGGGRGNDGGGDQHGCGYNGDRSGRGGNGGGGGGNNRDKFTTSHNGYRYT